MYKKLYFLFLINITLSAWGVCLASTPTYLPNVLNNYSYKQERGVIAEYREGGINIQRVNFESTEHKILASGDIGAFSVSIDGNLLAYTKKYGDGITVIRIDDGKILYTGDRADQEFLRWADSKNQLTFYDARNKKLYLVDFDNNAKVTSVKADGDLAAAKWDNNCPCFNYQFIPLEGPGLYGVFRVVNGRLVNQKDINSLLTSPDGKYYLVPQSVEETGNFISVYKRSSGKLINKIMSRSPLTGRIGLLWKLNIVRVLGISGTIQLDTGRIISSPNGQLRLEQDYYKKPPPYNFYDLASDRQGYVLMWNLKKKIFEVEDISTGKIIKTYKKFW